MRYWHDSDQLRRDVRCAPAATHRRFLAGKRQITAASARAPTDFCVRDIETF
jgi:hypothetical protein